MRRLLALFLALLLTFALAELELQFIDVGVRPVSHETA
jgi:hypothetical protein